MKRLLFASLMILSINLSYAQTKLGLKFAPSVISQRIESGQDSIYLEKGPNAIVFPVLLSIDFPMGRNYYFGSGVGYVSRRINLVKNQSEVGSESKSYNVQYVQIPATFKLFTSEVALDKRLYFQFGPVFDIAVHTRETDPDVSMINQFQPLDVTLLFATGMEIQIGAYTALGLGISYSRDLVNIVKTPAEGLQGVSIKNDLFALELSIKF